MDPGQGIGKLGFRRWYERQLVEAHAWLISGLLALILAASLVELQATATPAATRLVLIAGAVLSLAGVALAWRRYRRDLAVAEHYGESANCPGCRSYGRIEVLRCSPAGDPTTARLQVRCRKCGREWPIEPPPAPSS